MPDCASFDCSKWDQVQYLQDQCDEIQKHKWIESEKAGQDLGPQAARDWVAKHAADFRDFAMASGRYKKS